MHDRYIEDLEPLSNVPSTGWSRLVSNRIVKASMTSEFNSNNLNEYDLASDSTAFPN